MIIINIPELAPGMNALMRMHFRTYGKLRDKWKLMLMAETRAKVLGPCEIFIDRYYASQPLDLDNLWSSCKIPLDAMRGAGIIPDDNTKIVTSLKCDQFKVANRAEQRTQIVIRDPQAR